MSKERPVTKILREIIGDEKPAVNFCHPGLWLDRFARRVDQKEQYKEIKTICDFNKKAAKNNGKHGEGAILLEKVRSSRKENLIALGADRLTLTARTVGSFSLHLARASALENAGICLHPVYGFAYIPGVALKGMTHAYACEVWLPVQNEKQEAWKQICKVFGWVQDKLAEKYGVKASENESIGGVIFHDAWPLEWPKLICDIVNNHHPRYYSGEENAPPGDWENPNPVYFIAIAPDTKFDFPLSLRPAAVLSEPGNGEPALELACQWLLGALEHRGAGAKTNAGYGRFQLYKAPDKYSDLKKDADVIWQKAVNKDTGVFREETFTLELVTPAFLAGADQKEGDCELRPATLRGHLRWWWRTMHAGYFDVATLKRLEDAIWGSADKGGAVSIDLIPLTSLTKKLFNIRDKSKKWSMSSDFQREHDIIPPPKGHSPGLFYITYGMNDGDIQRNCLEPLIQWKLKISSRDTNWERQSIAAQDVLEQAKSALALLIQFGGVGSKSRNGFGSINLVNKKQLEDYYPNSILKMAFSFRDSVKLASSPIQNIYSLSFCSCDNEILMKTIETRWKDPWFVLDQIGASYESFLQSDKSTGHGKHCEQKLAFGLPRQIHGPRNQPMRHQNTDTHQSPIHLQGLKGNRYPSPFFFHSDRNEDQTYSIRVTAFPAPFLPDIETSRRMLEALLKHLDKDLKERADKYKDKGGNPPYPPAIANSAPGENSAPVSKRPELPRTGERVEAALLAEKTRKGGWRAQHAASGIIGPIQNTKDVPADQKAGDIITLVVASVNEQGIAFRYPTKPDEDQTRKTQNKSGRGQDRRNQS